MRLGRPLKFQSIKDLEARIARYFKACDKNEKPYSITGLAVSLDTNRATLCNYEEREDYSDVIDRAKTKCEQWVEENMLMNKANATGCIFTLKNNYDWRDKNEVDHTSSDRTMSPTKAVAELTDDELEEIIARNS